MNDYCPELQPLHTPSVLRVQHSESLQLKVYLYRKYRKKGISGEKSLHLFLKVKGLNIWEIQLNGKLWSTNEEKT